MWMVVPQHRTTPTLRKRACMVSLFWGGTSSVKRFLVMFSHYDLLVGRVADLNTPALI